MLYLTLIYMAVMPVILWVTRLDLNRERRFTQMIASSLCVWQKRAIEAENELDVWRSWSGRKGADSDRSLS